MDAFVIRATLVPAFMRLAGEANWWAPQSMRRFHERIGISESEPRARSRRPNGGSPSRWDHDDGRAPGHGAAGPAPGAARASGCARRSSTATEQPADRDGRRGRGVDPGDRRRRRRHAAVDLPALRRQGRAASVAVCERALRGLRRRDRGRPAPAIDDPVEALRRRGQAYVRFGLEQPGAVPHPVHGPDRRRPPASTSSTGAGRRRVPRTSSTPCSAPSTPVTSGPSTPCVAATALWTGGARHHVAADLAARLPVARRRCARRPRLRHPDPRLREPVPQPKESP